jgi:hypothetical protein
MKSESTFKSLLQVALLTVATILSFHCLGQNPRPVAVSLVSGFERALINDLNMRIAGVQTIQIEAITVASEGSSKSESFILVANSIKSACSKSVHRYLARGQDFGPSQLTMRAEILPSKGNDIVTFVYVRDASGTVLFAETYSLKGKNTPKPLPNLLLTLNSSIQPNLQLSYLTNQGLDTNNVNFYGTVVGVNLTGSQYVTGRQDLTFGYAVGLMMTIPTFGDSQDPLPIIVSLSAGVSSELLIKEFQLFNLDSKLAWKSAILTDLSQHNFGRYNVSSDLGLYITKNFSVRSGIELCHRSLIPWAPSSIGLSNFDRLYIGLGLGF